MKIKLIGFFVFISVFITACGGGGSGSYSSSSSSQAAAALQNLNTGNACKKAWYTSTFPDPSSTDTVFNNYSFFWQSTSFQEMPVCFNYYEATDAISSTGVEADAGSNKLGFENQAFGREIVLDASL